MKFLVSLVMFSLLVNGFASAQTLIQDSCKKAAKDPDFKYDFCVNSLTQDPQSKAATNLEGLVLASTKNAAANATNVKKIAEKILKGKRYEKGYESALSTCVEVFDDAIYTLNEAFTYVRSHDYREAVDRLSAALTDSDTCEQGFMDLKQQNPIANENNILSQKITIPLVFASML